MPLPEHVEAWIRGQHKDRKLMKELRAFLIRLSATDSTPAPVAEQVGKLLELSDLREIKTSGIAGLLYMSERSLARKLHAGNTSFKCLLDEERRNRYLALREEGKLTADQIAQTLGFANVKSFYRARKHWTVQRGPATRLRYSRRIDSASKMQPIGRKSS